jgi:hypothetical protein
VTLFSVRRGASASEALVAIRVAQQELLLAKTLLRKPVVNEVESLLVLARSALKERRYEASVAAAHKAYQRMVEQ